MTQDQTWEDRYKSNTGTLPWDIGAPAPELVAALPVLDLPCKNVLEIGCGTGTNAIWLFQQNYKVIATEIAPTALDKARQKASEAKAAITFKLSDICEELPVEKKSMGFVFDRGVFHTIPADKRSVFVEQVAHCLMPGGYWLSLIGNADEVKAEGPIKLSAATIINHVEPFFELYKLERTTFTIPNTGMYLAWIGLFRLRSGG